MKPPIILQFFIQTAEEGGYTAHAVEYPIYTQGETLDETVLNIKDAVECHFGEDDEKHRTLPVMINFALPAMA
ncbi:MAG: type II toxin-antitoxin system HicB family antitoxin [Minisyncoccia bacterium]